MKKTKFQFLNAIIVLLGVFSLITFQSCDDDAPKAEDPIASFQFEVDETDFQVVTFTNYSVNAETYSWNFGDGETSTDKDPVHTYAEAGSYEVTLTAINADDVSAEFSTSLTITDPDDATALLTGGSSKTWKLYREESSIVLGPDADLASTWWALTNDGSRPCLYNQTFTFNTDGEFIFDDMGYTWGENDVFTGTDFYEVCFEALAENMVKEDGTDVSAWLSGTHAYSYDPVVGEITVTGDGAYLGIIKCGTSGYVTTPQSAVTYQISIEEFVGYDLMTISVYYSTEGNYWQTIYVNYSDESLEPELVEEAEEWVGEDLTDITPSLMNVTFASRDAADLVVLDTVDSGSNVDFGVDDPADATAAKVGQFNRTTDSWQELKFRTYPDVQDIQFDNLSTVSVDVYVPSTNDYSDTTLTKGIVLGFGDISETENNEWWNDNFQFEVGSDTVDTDVWTTYTFDLTDAKARVDLDMIYVGIGGGGHAAPGTFYIRNLIFE